MPTASPYACICGTLSTATKVRKQHGSRHIVALGRLRPGLRQPLCFAAASPAIADDPTDRRGLWFSVQFGARTADGLLDFPLADMAEAPLLHSPSVSAIALDEWLAGSGRIEESVEGSSFKRRP